jgi:DNA-binding MarR family transcriptional regulator
METETTLSRDLADLALALMRIVKREFKAEAGAHAPTLTQFRMLHKIKGGVRQVGTLAEAFGISQPATSIMVNTMVKAGLLKRVPHAGDRRQIELHLTAKATAELETIYKRAFARIDARLSSLSAARKDAIGKQIREVSLLLSQSEVRHE